MNDKELEEYINKIEPMKIIFLDYDGVVNTPIWNEEGKCGYNYPSDGKVNNYQAIMWLNELCKKKNECQNSCI